MRDLNVLCYGGGVNSVALLMECTKQGIIFDAIIFSDPGSEKKATYVYNSMINDWCIAHGQPEITPLFQVNAEGNFIGLFADSIVNKSLPSIVYGYKTCSQKFKRFPQDKWMNNWQPALNAWAAGYKVVKYIGYDADESHRTGKDFTDSKYNCAYKLVDWDWGRFECVKRILDEGLPLPPKSSCTFCPSMKPYEIIDLYNTERSAFYDAVWMERNASENLTAVRGLGRNWSWWDLIVAYKYLNLIKRKGVSLEKAPPEYIQKLMKKIRRSKPPVLAEKAEAVVNDLFSNSMEISCECYDGS